MGRRKLAATDPRKRSRVVTLKLTAAERRVLDRLVDLPPESLFVWARVPHKQRKPCGGSKPTASSVLRALLSLARRLFESDVDRAAKLQAMDEWLQLRGHHRLSTGKSVGTSAAARRLRIDKDRFRELAKRLGLVGVRGAENRDYFSEADIERMREYLATEAGRTGASSSGS